MLAPPLRDVFDTRTSPPGYAIANGTLQPRPAHRRPLPVPPGASLIAELSQQRPPNRKPPKNKQSPPNKTTPLKTTTAINLIHLLLGKIYISE